MNAFEDGQRVRYTGVTGLNTRWSGREGVVTDSYRDFDGNRTNVRLDGEDHSVSFDEDDLEAVKSVYSIENRGEDTGSATLELTDTEAALVRRVIDALNDENYPYVPVLEMKKKESK